VTGVIHLEGRARILGDDVNTDYIIASRRKRATLDERILKQYLLETVDPAFAASVHPGDMLVAGWNFGCGSAMEIAATVILASGVKAVLARSFARTFFRNSVNNGLVPIECDTTRIREGDLLAIDVTGEAINAVNRTTGTPIPAVVLPALMSRILACGGLVELIRRGGWNASPA
jgi:3-isopropylmalate/(R)-2-methylmalate dehydratase small subunit